MADYRELAERLLMQPATPSGEPEESELLLDQMPPELPARLSVPVGAQVLGSVVRRSAGQVTGSEVVMNVPGPPEAAIEFYQDELSRQGWTPPVQGMDGRGGFMPMVRTLSRHF